MLLHCVCYNNPKTYVRVYASFELCGRTTNIAKEYQRLYVVIVRGLIYRVCFNSGNTKAWWGQGETMCWSKIEWRVPSKGSSKGTSRSLALCVIYLWDKNPHFSNRLLKSEVISINKISTGCNTFVKYQAISNYYFLFLLLLQLAAVAALCVQYESEFRPSMSIVVKALSPLLVNAPYQPAAAPDVSSDAWQHEQLKTHVKKHHLLSVCHFFHELFIFRKIRIVCVCLLERKGRGKSNAFVLNPCTSCLRAAAVEINYLIYTLVHPLPFPCFSFFFFFWNGHPCNLPLLCCWVASEPNFLNRSNWVWIVQSNATRLHKALRERERENRLT